MITKGIKETFTARTAVLVVSAVLAFVVARLLHQHLLSRIEFLRRIPEVSDIIVAVLGGGLLKGNVGEAVIIGAGVSLVDNIMTRVGFDLERPAIPAPR